MAPDNLNELGKAQRDLWVIPEGAQPSPVECNCMWTQDYGFVPESDCQLHDNEDFLAFVNFIETRGAENMESLIVDNINNHLADIHRYEDEDTKVAKEYVLAISNVLSMIENHGINQAQKNNYKEPEDEEKGN